MTLASAVREVLGVGTPATVPSHMLLPRDRVGYGYAPVKSGKGKSKGEKKQIALSALTLLAFLFFLNILQNCLKEQSDENKATTMVMSAVSQMPILVQGREPEEVAEDSGGSNRGKRSVDVQDGQKKRIDTSRQQKFIANYKEGDEEWMRGLTHITEDEINNQRVKTDRMIWKNNKLEGSTPAQHPNKHVKINKLIKSPILSDLKTEKRAEEKPLEVKSIEFETKRPSLNRGVDFHEFNEPERRLSWENYLGDIGTPLIFQEENGVLSTPRSRRSGLGTTPTSDEQTEGDNNIKTQEENDIMRINEKVREALQVPTPVNSAETSTERLYPIYKPPGQQLYPNHRYTPQQPTKQTLQVPRYPYRFRYSGYPTYPSRNRFVQPYSPYRRADYADYYPMSVVGQHGGPQDLGDEEMGFNVVKFVWTMISAFAKPIARLVPSFAKVGPPSDARCYDLLVCEAHRASAFMGPTAEVMATSLRFAPLPS